MLRTLLAVGAVTLAFGATLVIGGERLGAWDSPTSASLPKGDAVAFKARRPAADRETRRQPKPNASKAARATKPPTWVSQLDALCRRAEASTAAMQEPQTLPELRMYLQRMAALSRRWNRQASAGPLARAARRHPDVVRRLHGLFAEERLLIKDARAAAERSDVTAFGELGPLMVTNGVEQSQLLVSLGAQDCALPPDLS
jgi:hypothetical protein